MQQQSTALALHFSRHQRCCLKLRRPLRGSKAMAHKYTMNPPATPTHRVPFPVAIAIIRSPAAGAAAAAVTAVSVASIVAPIVPIGLSPIRPFPMTASAVAPFVPAPARSVVGAGSLVAVATALVSPARSRSRVMLGGEGVTSG